MYLGAVGNRCRNKNDMAENLAGPEALPPRIRSITHQIDPLRRVFYCLIPQRLLRGRLVMNGGYPPLTNKSALRFLHAEVFSSAARLKRGDDYDSYRIDQKENGN